VVRFLGGGGIFMSLLVALICLLSSGHGPLPMKPGPTIHLVLIFNDFDVC
jgi:hypothetical protein